MCIRTPLRKRVNIPFAFYTQISGCYVSASPCYKKGKNRPISTSKNALLNCSLVAVCTAVPTLPLNQDLFENLLGKGLKTGVATFHQISSAISSTTFETNLRRTIKGVESGLVGMNDGECGQTQFEKPEAQVPDTNQRKVNRFAPLMEIKVTKTRDSLNLPSQNQCCSS